MLLWKFTTEVLEDLEKCSTKIDSKSASAKIHAWSIKGPWEKFRNKQIIFWKSTFQTWKKNGEKIFFNIDSKCSCENSPQKHQRSLKNILQKSPLNRLFWKSTIGALKAHEDIPKSLLKIHFKSFKGPQKYSLQMFSQKSKINASWKYFPLNQILMVRWKSTFEAFKVLEYLKYWKKNRLKIKNLRKVEV